MKFERAYVDGLPFAKAMGGSPKVGTGDRLYRYSVYIEEGTHVRREKFVKTIEAILGDERSWIRGGELSFQRVDHDADTHCILALPDTVDRLCAPLDTEGKVSCCMGQKVVLNAKRWRNAVEHWTGPVETYREMVTNHEFGHRTGHGHGWCPGPGARAPVMQQQTYGLQGCREGSWPLDSEL